MYSYFTPHPVPIQLPRSPTGIVSLEYDLALNVECNIVGFQENHHGIRCGECHDRHGV